MIFLYLFLCFDLALHIEISSDVYQVMFLTMSFDYDLLDSVMNSKRQNSQKDYNMHNQ